MTIRPSRLGLAALLLALLPLGCNETPAPPAPAASNATASAPAPKLPGGTPAFHKSKMMMR